MKYLMMRQTTNLTAGVRPWGRTWTGKLIETKLALVLVLCAGLPWIAAGRPALADMINLANGNSVVQIDPASSSGVDSWTVNGVNQLYQQWFWYRVGNSGPASSIDTLGTAIISDSTASGATVTFTGTNGLSVTVAYTLQGGSSKSSGAALSEIVTLGNTGESALDLHFFQYANFNLSGASQDSIQFPSSMSVEQTTALNSKSLSETILFPAPDYREANLVPVTLSEFSGSAFATLSNANVGSSGPYGTGDMSWAYEWDDSLSPGDSFQINKSMNLSGVLAVPEPSTLALALTACLALVGLARRRRA